MDQRINKVQRVSSPSQLAESLNATNQFGHHAESQPLYQMSRLYSSILAPAHRSQIIRKGKILVIVENSLQSTEVYCQMMELN